MIHKALLAVNGVLGCFDEMEIRPIWTAFGVTDAVHQTDVNGLSIFSGSV